MWAKNRIFFACLPVNMQLYISVHGLGHTFSLSPYMQTKMQKWFIVKKVKIKYTSIFYLYLKEVRQIKKAGLEPYSPC